MTMRMLSKAELLSRHATHQTGEAWTESDIIAQLEVLPGWEYSHSVLSNTYQFKNYYDTLAFVNALAWVIHREDHHPDLVVSYNHCTVSFTTHSVQGISDNDFICAAKTDAVFAQTYR